MKQNVNYISLNIFMMAVEQYSVCDVSWQSRRPYQLLQSPHGRSFYIVLHNDVSNHDLHVFIHCSKGMCRNVKTVCLTPCFHDRALSGACVLLMFSCEGNNFLHSELIQ
jgi:hypothetical protein